MSAWLEVAENFAGPIATIGASIAAAWITYKFGMIQAEIARGQAKIAEAQKEIATSQRDIAFDKLKNDLFEKRYEIYLAAKRVIEAIFNKSPVDASDPEIRKLRLKLDEARFFFPPDTRTYCENIEKHVYEVLVASQASSGYSPDHPEQHKLRDMQSKSEIVLVSIYAELAKKFERDLGFAQLTKIAES